MPAMSSLRPELRAILRITRNPIVATILKSQCVGVGEYAPDFELTGPDGRARLLADVASEVPLVILFRHGNWCLACLVETAEIRRLADEIAAAGAKLVVIAPESSVVADSREPFSAGVLFVIDQIARIACVYGLTVIVPAELAGRAGIQLPIIGDNGEQGIVAPTTLVVDRNGVIVWAAIDPDHSRTGHASEFASELRRLRAA